MYLHTAPHPYVSSDSLDSSDTEDYSVAIADAEIVYPPPEPIRIDWTTVPEFAHGLRLNDRRCPSHSPRAVPLDETEANAQARRNQLASFQFHWAVRMAFRSIARATQRPYSPVVRKAIAEAARESPSQWQADAEAAYQRRLKEWRATMGIVAKPRPKRNAPKNTRYDGCQNPCWLNSRLQLGTTKSERLTAEQIACIPKTHENDGTPTSRLEVNYNAVQSFEDRFGNESDALLNIAESDAAQICSSGNYRNGKPLFDGGAPNTMARFYGRAPGHKAIGDVERQILPLLDDGATIKEVIARGYSRRTVYDVVERHGDALGIDIEEAIIPLRSVRTVVLLERLRALGFGELVEYVEAGRHSKPCPDRRRFSNAVAAKLNRLGR